MVKGEVMELHTPDIRLFDVVFDVHQEAVCLDLLESKGELVRRLRLNVLHPGCIGVDVQPATVLSDERDSFPVGDNRHPTRSYIRSTRDRTLGWASAPE